MVTKKSGGIKWTKIFGITFLTSTLVAAALLANDTTRKFLINSDAAEPCKRCKGIFTPVCSEFYYDYARQNIDIMIARQAGNEVEAKRLEDKLDKYMEQNEGLNSRCSNENRDSNQCYETCERNIDNQNRRIPNNVNNLTHPNLPRPY